MRIIHLFSSRAALAAAAHARAVDRARARAAARAHVAARARAAAVQRPQPQVELLHFSSPQSVLHLLQSDQPVIKLCKAHSFPDLRYDYMRGMLGIDPKKKRAEASGWVLLENVIWLQHNDHGVIAVTGPTSLLEHHEDICTNAMLPLSALNMGYESAQKLCVGAREPMGWKLMEKPPWAAVLAESSGEEARPARRPEQGVRAVPRGGKEPRARCARSSESGETAHGVDIGCPAA